MHHALTQLSIVCIVLTLSTCKALGQNGKLTHVFLLIQAMSLKANEQLLRVNCRLDAVHMMFMSFLGKQFKEFAHLILSTSMLGSTCGRFTIMHGQLFTANQPTFYNDST